MINKIKSLIAKRASAEADVVLMESVIEHQEVADMFLSEAGETTITDVYRGIDVSDDPDDKELTELLDKIPESDSDDEEILNKMLSSDDDITAEEILEACGKSVPKDFGV